MVCGILSPSGMKQLPFDSHYSSWMMEQLCEDDLDLATLSTPTAVTSRLHVTAGPRPCFLFALTNLREFATVTAGLGPCSKIVDKNSSGFDSAGHRPCLKIVFKVTTAAWRRAASYIVFSHKRPAALAFI